MPNRKKIVMPLAAALAFALVLWLAFHDRSREPVAPSPAVKSSRADAPAQVAQGVAVNPGVRARTPARNAGPGSSRS
jgi:hypothetical protein